MGASQFSFRGICLYTPLRDHHLLTFLKQHLLHQLPSRGALLTETWIIVMPAPCVLFYISLQFAGLYFQVYTVCVVAVCGTISQRYIADRAVTAESIPSVPPETTCSNTVLLVLIT
jgi:hypothetical protein